MKKKSTVVPENPGVFSQESKKGDFPVVSKVEAKSQKPRSRSRSKQVAAKTEVGESFSKRSQDSSISHDGVCREVACEGLATSGDYCRSHYIKNWQKIKRKEVILKEKKLNHYIEELVVKYPDKYIETIRQDLESDKDFAKVISDLDLDEGMDDFDVEGGDGMDGLIDTIKRDFDDDEGVF